MASGASGEKAIVADIWGQGNAYEDFMGRWSRQVAPRFVSWLHARPGLRWIDAGCGTGALTTAVLDLASPVSVLAVDPSSGFVDEARRLLDDPRVEFDVMAAEDLPARAGDVVVSGLMLNFVADVDVVLAAMTRAAPGGTVAAYVWDYGGGMQLLRTFWDVACSLDASAIDRDESHRFQICEPGGLTRAWVAAGLTNVRSAGLEITMEFRDFDDLWTPFLGGTGTAPAYVATLDENTQKHLRAELQRMVHTDPDGHIRMPARAWAVRGTVV
jgi:SAM-dependent methyltransferase